MANKNVIAGKEAQVKDLAEHMKNHKEQHNQKSIRFKW